MIRKFKSLLAVKIFELTGNEIGEIKKQQDKSNRYYQNVLPDFTLTKEKGTIIGADYYYQFTETGDEKYILFDANTTDDILNEEISNGGLESILKDIDLRPHFNQLIKLNHNNIIHHTLETSQYLMITTTYIGGDMWNPDWDVEFSVDGVITNDLTLIKEEEYERRRTTDTKSNTENVLSDPI